MNIEEFVKENIEEINKSISNFKESRKREYNDVEIKKSSLEIERRCITVLPLFFSPPLPEEDLTGTPDNAINTLLL